MSDIETVRDLVNEGLVSHGQVRALAKALFSEPVEHLAADISGFDGYTVTLPAFESLPDHVQAFITKALYDSRAVNVLAAEKVTLGKEIFDKIEAEESDDG